MSEELQINLAEQIRETYREANQLAEEAKGYASQAVTKAIECGTLLLQQKESLVRGSWLEWLEIHVPELPHRTAQHYMRLTKSAMNDAGLMQSVENQANHTQRVAYLTDAPTMKQAFVALGLLPAPKDKGAEPSEPNKPWVRFTRHLDGFRLWFAKRTEEEPLTKWDEDARRILKNELRWFAELYERL